MFNGTKIKEVTVAANGTGSAYFTVDGSPYASVQVVKMAGATTMQNFEVAYSNFSGRDVPGVELRAGGVVPLTGSGTSLYWAPDGAVPAAAFTASAAPASLMLNLSGSMGARHVRFTWGSATGGIFKIALTTKE